MTNLRILTIIMMMGLFFSSTANAATKEEKRVSDAADVLDQLTRIPEKSIPPSLLSNAYAVAVIPNVVRAAFWVGVSRGKGVLVVRNDDDSWSNPVFVSITSGSFGWQVGADSTDVILVFKTRKGVDGIAKGKFTLGAGASVAAGPVGRNASASTDVQLQAEVYSYSRSRGLFAGVALEGASVRMDRKANSAYYGSADMTPDDIFASSPMIAPDTANTFVQVLTAQTARLPVQPGMQTGVTQPSNTDAVDAAAEQSEVVTYGMPDPGDSEDDATDESE